jgi:hypothetical protein
MIAAIEWGCPFVLYWELYDNEGTTDKPGGFWLINEKNEKQPLWHTHLALLRMGEEAPRGHQGAHRAVSC